jgi:hypothetical protein
MGGEDVGPRRLAPLDGQVLQHLVRHEACIGRAPDRHMHLGDGASVARECGANLNHSDTASTARGSPPITAASRARSVRLRSDQVEIAVEHRLQSPAPPAPLYVAHQRCGAAEIAAHHGVRFARARQKPDELAMSVLRSRFLPRSRHGLDTRYGALPVFNIGLFQDVDPRLALKRAKGAEAADLQHRRAGPFWRRALLAQQRSDLLTGDAARRAEMVAELGRGAEILPSSKIISEQDLE